MTMRRIRELNRKIREDINSIDESSGETIFVERRLGRKDRRIVHTFLADDRRCGIADRRKKTISA